MPPDITAGLPALTASPPGAAAGLKPAEPPAAGASSAALFASLLAQSSPPLPTAPAAAATPKQAPALTQAPAAQTISAALALQPPAKMTAGTAAANTGVQAAGTQPAPKSWKTMDILPKLSVPVKEKSKAPANELLLQNTQAQVPNEPAHKTPAVASLLSAPVTTASVSGAAGVSALPYPVQAFPVQAFPVQASPVQPVSVQPVPVQVPLVQSALPSAQMPVPSAGTALSALTIAAPPPAPFAMPQANSASQAPVKVPRLLQSAPGAGPAPLELPRTWALAAPVSVPSQLTLPSSALAPQAGETAPPDGNAALPAARPLAASLLASAGAKPQAVSLFQSQKPAQGPANLPALLRPQADLLQRLPPAPVPAFLAPAAAPAVAPGVLVQPALAVPSALPLAKSNAKFVPPALKPAGENADTIARTLPGETAVVKAKADAPPAAPSPNSAPQAAVPESAKTLDDKKTEEPAPALKAVAVPAETQAAAPASQAAQLSSKPLSAADHAALVPQVAEGVEAMPLPARPGAAQQMSLQLHPKDWGSLQVSVSVVAGPDAGSAKTVTAHIVAETPQVKAALQSQSGALHQALRASGLNLEHLTVSVKPPAEPVKAASASASAGFSPGQEQSGQEQSGQTSSGSQPQSSPQTGQPSGAAAFGGTAFGSGSQDTRQGQAPPAFASASAPAEPDTEDSTIERLPMRPVLGRIDTLA